MFDVPLAEEDEAMEEVFAVSGSVMFSVDWVLLSTPEFPYLSFEVIIAPPVEAKLEPTPLPLLKFGSITSGTLVLGIIT